MTAVVVNLCKELLLFYREVFLGGIVTGTDGVANLVEKARVPVGGRRWLARDERGAGDRVCHGNAGFTHR